MKKIKSLLLATLFLSAFFYTGSRSVAAMQTEPASGSEQPAPITNSLHVVNGRLYYYDSQGLPVKNILKKVDGYYYYFDAEGGAVTNSLKKVEENYYYFNAKGRAVTSALKKIKGNYYYFNAKGRAATNALKKVNGNCYYFNAKGKAATDALKRIESKYYYFAANGRAVTDKWKKVNEKKYYFKKNGAAATESYKIKGSYYVFNQNGQLLTPEKTSRKKVNGTYYYVNSKGHPVTGWHTKDQKTTWDTDVFYVHKNGKCAANETVEGVKFGSNAYAKNRDQALAKAAAKDFIRRYTKSGDSKYNKLQKCAKRVVATFSYTGSKKCRGFDKDDWVYRAALEAILTEGGDCYYIAATIGAIADALGYENVSVIHLAMGHGYVRIGTKGNYIYYDNMGPVYGGKKPRYPNGKIKRTFTFIS